MENPGEGYNNVITFNYLWNMIKKLTSVGNSKAVILPVELIKKYNLGKEVFLEETENGILIRSTAKSSFQLKLDKLRRNKVEIYKRMESQANDPDTIAYYNNPENDLSDVDPDIIEE